MYYDRVHNKIAINHIRIELFLRLALQEGWPETFTPSSHCAWVPVVRGRE